MRTDLVFYEPHEYARSKPKKLMPIPQLDIDTQGRFRFNPAAAEMLRLRANQRVSLGNSRADAREWFLMLIKDGGFPLRDTGKGSYGFYSRSLRTLLLSTLPHPPESKGLVLKLDPLTIEEESGAEIYPLLTAAYYYPPRPAEAPAPPEVSRRVLSLMVPGLLGVLHQADLPA